MTSQLLFGLETVSMVTVFVTQTWEGKWLIKSEILLMCFAELRSQVVVVEKSFWLVNQTPAAERSAGSDSCKKKKKKEEKVDLLLDAAGVSTPDWLRQEISCGPSHQERSLREPPNLLGMMSVMVSLELQSAKVKLLSVDVVSCCELLLLGLVAAQHNTTRTKQNVHQS